MFDEWRATAPELDDVQSQSVSVPGRPAAFAGADVVDYRTNIEDPCDSNEAVAVLELRGLYASASVEVPGDRLIGEGPVSHDAYFRPLRVPFDPEEGGELRVRCRAPEDQFGGIHDTDLVPEEDGVPGIWWDASLEARPVPYIESIDVRPVVDEDGVRLSLRMTVVSDGPLDERITYSIKPAGDHTSRGIMERASVESAGSGRTTVEHTVEVHDPNLWWPRTLGEQNRYTLRAKLDGDELGVTTGICDVRREGGQLLVNGEAIHLRGVNLLTSDPEDIDRAIECNANLVRAHAHALPRSVYERANEAGMLVWQDLPLTGPGGFDTERGEQLAAALGNQYGRHPSLAAISIHDDPVEAFGDGLGSGLLDRMRLRWRAWRSEYDAEPVRGLAEAVPVAVPTVPIIGGPGVDADAGSYYPGWQYGQPEDITTLFQRYPVDIVAEYGAGALATDGRSAEDAAGFDEAIHERRVSGDADASQQYQADLLTAIAGHLRQERVGSIAFALRDTDQAGMGVYGTDGSEKAGAEALAEAYEPVRAYVAEPDETESEIVLLNDRPHGFSSELFYEVGKESGSLELTVSPQGRWVGGPIALPADAETVHLEVDVEGEHKQWEYSI